MRRGIHCAGNFLIDYIKIIDKWPNQGMLANIGNEAIGTGGGPYNVLINLAKMNVNFPLFATGIIGKDTAGQYIIDDLKHHNIDTSSVFVTEKQPTSYTIVMSEKNTGQRTFFHHRGTNQLLDEHHFSTVCSNTKIFYLGYLLLLDKLDKPDNEYGVVAARVLKQLKDTGFKTCVDMVSDENQNYQKIVNPCLQYVDYLIVNEIEAGNSVGFKIRNQDLTINQQHLQKTAERLLKQGVNEIVVIHFPEGAIACSKIGELKYMPSFSIAKEKISGTTGAGDAFCAGMLYGIHEELNLEMCLKIAHASAHFNLLNPTSTGGAVEIENILDFLEKFTPGKQN